MTVNNIKIAMLNWKDFFGGEIMYTDEIKKAKTKNELLSIMDRYIKHIEAIGNDSICNAEKFRRTLR